MSRIRFHLILPMFLAACLLLASAAAAFAGEQPQGTGTQEAIAYRVPTFVDAKHPEKGMTRDNAYCTDCTLMSTLSDEQLKNLGPAGTCSTAT